MMASFVLVLSDKQLSVLANLLNDELTRLVNHESYPFYIPPEKKTDYLVVVNELYPVVTQNDSGFFRGN